MKIGVARETAAGERRVALVPETLGKLTAAGLEILVEKGAGDGSFLPDAAYTEAGAKVVSRDELYKSADVILRVQKPGDADVKSLRSGQAVVGLLAPLLDPKLMATLAKAGITAISLELILAVVALRMLRQGRDDPRAWSLFAIFGKLERMAIRGEVDVERPN